ncbi:immunity protein TriTu family protein [Methylomonas sp. MED-D]|uniref:immunity protein TriTu family protein n=1 Tax=unclassified Methylomonas TaxID=2608980 RepID=UPI0028A49BEC|nr:hypothetical protein [Methylomonas sp. MV1]MDT4329986.1 hypothetical protein [Methylomonas sp. MV1]
MLDTFIGWAKQITDKALGNDVEARVTESEMSHNPSARLDIDTPTMVARITYWESGDFDAEIIELETERTIFSSHGSLHEGRAFSEQFADFFESLSIAGPSDYA